MPRTSLIQTCGTCFFALCLIIVFLNVLAFVFTTFAAAFTWIFAADTNWTLLKAHIPTSAEVSAVPSKNAWSMQGLLIFWAVVSIAGSLVLVGIGSLVYDLSVATTPKDS